MDKTRPSAVSSAVQSQTDKARQEISFRAVGLLWWAGLKDGICFHRCMIYFVYDPQILIKTGQCLALNGLIFLGSILLWNFGLSPGAKWMLQISLHGQEKAAFVELAHAVICTVFGLIWLLPVYCLSFALSCVWYQDIAKLALSVRQKRGSKASKPASKSRHGSHDQDAMVQIAQELYRVVLFAVFMAQTYLAGLLPVIGVVANFVLLSWLNAFYSFDYKWSLSQRSLEDRIHFFECHWAYFLGFGSICTLLTVPWPFFISAAIVALIYPLFILIAADADPGPAFTQVVKKEGRSGAGLRMRLPIFRTATSVTSWVINRGPQMLSLPQLCSKVTVRVVVSVIACLGLLWSMLKAWQNSREQR